MRSALLVLAVLSLVVVMAGCGGSSGQAVTPEPQGGVITGQITNTDGAADSYSIYVDGQLMQAKPARDGSFRIENVPEGDHVVSFVGENRMSGAYVNCRTRAGQETTVGDVETVVGGQIVGMVTQIEEGGGLKPLAGVEVIADPDVYWIQDDDGTPPVPGEKVYPLPPRDGSAVQFRAFTDERGSYLMPAVPSGSYVVTVNVPGLEQGVNWAWVEAGRTAVADFQMRKAIDPGVGVVSGTVYGVSSDSDARVPIAGATVEIMTDGGPWRPIPPDEPVRPMQRDGAAIAPPPYEFEVFRTLTDAEGHYSLNVPSGHLNIFVWAEGYEVEFEWFTLRADERVTKNFVLKEWDFPPVPPGPGPGPGPDPDPRPEPGRA